MMSSMLKFIPPDEPDSGLTASSGKTAPAKRTRVLLSCGPCRRSKLKCDREVPCGQCIKKGRVSACEYSPKPEKKTRSKGMAARLQRLEEMVRNMAEKGLVPPQAAQGNATAAAVNPENQNGPGNMAQVVQGETVTFVGATHFMAIMDDIEELKSFFDDDEDEFGDSPDSVERGSSSNIDHVAMGMPAPRSRDDLLAMLPDKTVMDRYIMRYFNSQSPSQHVIHRPTFAKQYAAFCRDPSSGHTHWLALLFMIIGLGIFFSSFSSPHEMKEESNISPLERFKMYRTAAGWALLQGKYSQPGPMTLPPFMLYIEAEFIVSRAAQMDCYLLIAILVRLMLKMGLHRDPDKLVNISPFNAEMRRRLWHMALQIDALVSFHMGLPSMVAGIQSDTQLPRNLLDEDFGEDTVELPPGRPMTDCTSVSYAICKSNLIGMFSRIANMAHALSPPAYAEVMRMDAGLDEKWKSLPPYLQVKPIEECVADSPIQVIQRFGLASMYNKCRCVLHRRFMTEQPPLPEHSYSRRICVEASLDILECQHTIHNACLPRGILSQHGWFVSSLAVHDFLLAAMIIFIAIQTETYGNTGWAPVGYTLPEKSRLLAVLRRSYFIWTAVSRDVPEVKKTAAILETMLKKLSGAEATVGGPSPGFELNGSLGQSSFPDSISMSNLNNTPKTSSFGTPLPTIPISFQAPVQPRSSAGLISSGLTMSPSDPTWMTLDNDLDWRFLDNFISGSGAGTEVNAETSQNWLGLDFNQILVSESSWQPQ